MSMVARDFGASRLGGLKRYAMATILAVALGLMTLVSMQQQRVIAAQQELIHSLARDSFAYLHVIAVGRRAHPPKGPATVSK